MNSEKPQLDILSRGKNGMPSENADSVQSAPIQAEHTPSQTPQDPSPRAVAYAVEHQQEEDPLTNHLTVLLVPAAIIGLLLVIVKSSEYYDILWYVTYAALILLSIGQGLKQNAQWSIVAISTGIATGLAAFINALYNLIQQQEVILLFGLITKPLFAGLLFGLFTGFIYLLLLLVLQYKERQKKNQ